MSRKFFPPRPTSRPTLYAYEDTNPQYEGLLKVGYTTVNVLGRVAQQYPTLRPGKLPYRIVLEECAMRNDGTVFTDRDVHRMLRLNGVKNPQGEWFAGTVAQITAVETPRKRVDPSALRAMTDAMPLQRESARDAVRRMRDEDRY